eukprot:4935578-Prymnesium_polylepis.3
MPLPWAGVRAAHLRDYWRRGRAVDAQNGRRVARNTVNRAIGMQVAAQPLVLALHGLAERADSIRLRVDLEYGPRMAGHAVHAPISAEDATEPFVPPHQRLSVEQLRNRLLIVSGIV